MRNTHHRQRDHDGVDLDSNVELDGATTNYADAADLHVVIADMDDRIDAAAGSGGVTVQDEGSPLSTTATTLNFTGAGVTASGSGATKTIDIPGGGSSVSPWKESCRAATTANITISTALNNGDTLDGVTLATNDRVLVKNQSTGSQNGIYVVGPSPSRATDFDSEADVLGAIVHVRQGTTNADSEWRMTTDGSITIDSTSLSFNQMGSSLWTNPTGSNITLRSGLNNITSTDTASSLTLASSTGDVDLSGNGYVALGVNNYTNGGASTDKHYLYGGHGLVLPVFTSDPSGGNSEEGQMYFNSNTNKFRGYDGTTWVDLN